MSNDAVESAREVVERFLEASMIPDPVTARTFMAADVTIIFTGGRRFAEPGESTAFNAKRYAWVKKRFERTDVVAGATEGEAVVYNTGTLYGAWPDGTPFDGNRYVDRFVVQDGKITRMDVWNDSAEILLTRAGLAEDLRQVAASRAAGKAA
jgi:ketosteroid isomerase-like protein